MNTAGRILLNSPARAAVQRRYVLPALLRLAGSLDGATILEVGCGRGVGTELLLDAARARRVDAIDVDPRMVRRARARVGTRASVAVGDMVRLEAGAGEYDAVVDFGSVHLVSEWRTALAEVARVLRPGGRYLFEEVASPLHRAVLPLATTHRVRGGFERTAFLDALASTDLTVVGTVDRRPLALIGTAGDLIGVAVRAR